MFPKLLKSIEHILPARRATNLLHRRKQFETEPLNHAENPLRHRLGQQPDSPRIDNIHADADRDRLAVAHPKLRELLQFVRRPVSKIQRTRRTALERIARRRDVLHVLPRALANHGLKRLRLKLRQRRHARRDKFEKRRVADERDFHRFDEPDPSLAHGQSVQQGKIVDDRMRHAKCAEPVFLTEKIHTILHPHPAVALAQTRRRQPHERNAAVRRRRRKAHEVEHRTAADRDDIRMPTQSRRLDGLPDDF